MALDYRGTHVDIAITAQEFADIYLPMVCRGVHTFTTYGFQVNMTGTLGDPVSLVGFKTKQDAEKYRRILMEVVGFQPISSWDINIPSVPEWKSTDYIECTKRNQSDEKPKRSRSFWPTVIGILLGLHIVLTWRPIWGWIEGIGQKALNTIDHPKIVGSLIVIWLVTRIIQFISYIFRRK